TSPNQTSGESGVALLRVGALYGQMKGKAFVNTGRLRENNFSQPLSGQVPNCRRLISCDFELPVQGRFHNRWNKPTITSFIVCCGGGNAAVQCFCHPPTSLRS